MRNRDKLDMRAEALMKYETIDRFQIDDIMDGRSPRPPKGWDDGRPGGGVTIDQPETGTLSDDDGRDGDAAGQPAGEH